MAKRSHVRLISGLLVFCVAGLLGCSSLPKHPVQNSELDSRAASFHKLGNKHFRAGQYEKAGACFEQVLVLHASVDDRPGVARAFSSIGRVHMALGELGLAEADFQQAHDATRGLQRPALEAQALGGLGAVELRRQHPQDARVWFEMALELPLTDPGNERAVLLHDLGSAYWKHGDTASAESCFRLALSMHESLGDPLGIAAACYSLAMLHKAEGNREQAMRLARRALTNDKRAENSHGVAQDLTLLGSLASRGGAVQKATDYYRRATLAWRALGRIDKAEEISVGLRELETETLSEAHR